MIPETGDVTCWGCKREWGPEVYGNMFDMNCVIHFNDEHTYRRSAEDSDDSEDDADGPIVERDCPQCKNDKMSYATLQLRSADEGQTIFYTCTKCKFKETENS